MSLEELEKIAKAEAKKPVISRSLEQQRIKDFKAGYNAAMKELAAISWDKVMNKIIDYIAEKEGTAENPTKKKK